MTDYTDIVKLIERLADIALDHVYLEDGDTACFNRDAFIHEIYPVLTEQHSKTKREAYESIIEELEQFNHYNGVLRREPSSESCRQLALELWHKYLDTPDSQSTEPKEGEK